MVDDAWVLAQFTLMMEEITSSTTVLTHLTRKAPRKIGVGAASVLSCAMLEKQVNALLVEFMIMELLANTGLIWKNTTIYLRKIGTGVANVVQCSMVDPLDLLDALLVATMTRMAVETTILPILTSQ
jgi:hypothetical protein